MVDALGLLASFFVGIRNHLSTLPASEAIIFDIGLILMIAAVFAFIAGLLKQPFIPAYVLAGFIIGPVMLGLVSNLHVIYAFSEIGVAFLLFIAGLEISFEKIREANLKKILFIGTLQSVLVFLFSYACKGLFNLSTIEASFVAVVLSFGSTMVAVKLLSEKRELVTLHGRLVLGVLLLEDLIAIIAILIFTSGGFMIGPLFASLVKFLGLLVTAYLIQKFILTRAINYSAKSSELLFLTALATLFFFLVLAHLSGMSIVIGAFIAGVTLANSPYRSELESKVSPLRDFFAILFFVALGTQISLVGLGERIPLVVFMVFTGMIMKPLIDLLLLRMSGFGNRTSLYSALTLSQLSEFALIIGVLGVSLGKIDASILSSIILATIITMSFTPYFLNYKQRLYSFFNPVLELLSFLPKSEKRLYSDGKKKEILLVGAHRVGSIILKGLESEKEKVVVLDYNPEITKALHAKKISYVYGEVLSPEILHHINLKDLRLVICTVPTFNDNEYLLRVVKKENPKARVVVTGARISEAKLLYDAGADYVIMPKLLAGEELLHLIKEDHHRLKKEREKHLKTLSDVHKILY